MGMRGSFKGLTPKESAKPRRSLLSRVVREGSPRGSNAAQQPSPTMKAGGAITVRSTRADAAKALRSPSGKA